MQLKQLKLSGFKSFVDPTIVPFSSQLVAVVGPNGCGKSNIIDAVRWVMGEGSAKTLRGESMADVIFNGSSNRKSVGQASVELVFENNMGRFTGQFASYQEISIKRLVTRDGESGYYLNGARCRRRDITDLFLGTGAGTRGYSIIGQNTISQIVEAKPEELRAFLEEAAGVSKYKERRRETLQRIHQTRENLLRVQDISNELAIQLNRLEKQAKAAELYKTLKQDERQFRGDILVLKWQNLTLEKELQHKTLSELLVTHEAHQADIARAIKSLALLDAQLVETQHSFQNTQTAFYQLGNEVTRLQETQQQKIREIQQIETDRLQIQTDIQLVDIQLQQDTNAYQQCLEEGAVFVQQAEALADKVLQLTEILKDSQLQAQVWNNKKQALQTSLNQYQQDMQVERVKKEHFETRYQETLVRLEKLALERSNFESVKCEADLEALNQQLIVANDLYETAVTHQKRIVFQGEALHKEIKEIEQQVLVSQDKTHALKIEHATHNAILQASLRKQPSDTLTNDYEGIRLVECIQVEEKWRAACEWVLGDALQAVTLASLTPLITAITSASGTFITGTKQPSAGLDRITALSTDSLICNDGYHALNNQSRDWITPSVNPCETSFSRLADKIQGFKPAWIYPLESILAVNNTEEAIAQLPFLCDNQSLITPDGLWLGKGWLRVADFKEYEETSLLLRQQKLVNVLEALNIAEEALEKCLQERDKLYALRAINEKEQLTSNQALNHAQQHLQTLNNQHQQKQHLKAQTLTQMTRVEAESADLKILLEELVTDKVYAEEALLSATHHTALFEEQLQTLLVEKAQGDDALIKSRTETEDAKALLQEYKLRSSREQLKAQQLNETINRGQVQKKKWSDRLSHLEQRSILLDSPDDLTKHALHDSLEKQMQLEQALSDIRQQLEALQSQVREINQIKGNAEQKDSAVQAQIVQCQLTEQSLVTRAEALLESLTELDRTTDVPLDPGIAETSIEQREKQLLTIAEKIKRLGAINLIAIDEYQTELSRKTHLDEQSQDLNEALTILESAIAKMDAETEDRLRETFNQVNNLFQVLFPRLFGGGTARLQLTCDNLLEAGVLVMAQPPGKRNSSIHLLSGGEKAMTAVALVFAIFQLNPSPFCMLDEVDAPLDDLNVVRFCALVKEMSQYVQFLLITHNKVTMELAEHLIGVTMREPGVSRIVAVDVAKEFSLAE